jgi:CHAT domain-containing protein
MAELQRAQGNYQQAELLLRQALELWNTETGPIHPHMAVSLNNLGELYRELSSYKKAAPYYQQALEINRRARGTGHPYEATILNNSAELYRQTGNYEQAELFYQQSLAIRQIKLGLTHPDSAQSLNNLATLAYIRGDWKQAEGLYEQTLTIRQASQGADHPDVAQTMNNIALLAYDRGEYIKAEQLMQQALAITRKARGEIHIDIAAILNNLALLYATISRRNEALALMSEAAAIDDQIIGQVFSLGSEYQRMQFLKRLRGSFDGFLSLLCQFFISEPDVVQAGFDLVLKRKGIGIEALAIQHDVQLSQRYPKLRELLSLRGQIAQKTLTGTGKEGIETHQETLGEWNRQREDLEADLARQIPEMNLALQLQVAHHQAIADMLPHNSILVDFICFDRLDFHAPHIPGKERERSGRYIAFVIQPGAIPVRLIDIGDAASVNKLVVALINSMTESSSATRNFNTRQTKTVEATYDDITATLSTTYFSSLFTALEGCSQVFLSPDGELARLPFEILPVEQGGMLIDQYHISYLSASRDLLRFQLPANHPANPSLVLGDPEFDLQQEVVLPTTDISSPLVAGQSQSTHSHLLHFVPLPGTRLESQQIAHLLDVDPILGSEATKMVLREAHSPHILHIATHGFFFPDQRTDDKPDMAVSSFTRSRLEDFLEQRVENPLLRSGLALAGINTWNQRKTTIEGMGILTAEEVSGLDLAATELVILSACETGLGEIQIGEGVIGLRRTFVLAGARTLIMSLWKIPDEQTQELMGEFYSALLAGQARAKALRTAQLTMKAHYPHPYYWGAFICQGDPGPLINKRVPSA